MTGLLRRGAIWRGCDRLRLVHTGLCRLAWFWRLRCTRLWLRWLCYVTRFFRLTWFRWLWHNALRLCSIRLRGLPLRSGLLA